MGVHWSVRAHAACSAVAWCCALNAMWIVFTLLGGVLLGLGPATVAASVLARRTARGEAARWSDFAVTWRKEFVRGNLVVLPIVAVTLVLLLNYAAWSQLGPEASLFRIITLIALGFVLGAGAYVGPMVAHYELPLRSVVPTATRFALARPLPTVLLLLVFATIAYATAEVPVLACTVSIGAWLHASTWLCVRFFTQNEDQLAAEHAQPAQGQPAQAQPAQAQPAQGQPEQGRPEQGRPESDWGLPSQPLRIR